MRAVRVRVGAVSDVQCAEVHGGGLQRAWDCGERVEADWLRVCVPQCVERHRRVQQLPLAGQRIDGLRGL